MNVREMAEWLLSLPDQEATVEVLRSESTAWDGDYVTTVQFDHAEHSEYTDLRGNPLISEDKPYYNQRTLLLGSKG